MEIQESFNRFIADMRIEGKAEGTLIEYENRLSRFKKYLIRHKKQLNEINHEDIVKFTREMFKFGLNSTTIKCELSTLYVYSLWAVKNGILNQVPLSPADYPKTSTAKKRIRRLSDEDIRVFIAYVDNLQENIRAAFWLMYGTGARVGEAAHLTVTDVQLKDRAVYINIKDAKWGSDRCIPILNQQAAKIVWQYRQSVGVTKQPLFRLSRRTLQWYATKFAQETGIEFHCHLLRHTFAAKLAEKGVPITTIQYLLGHRTVAMTAYYAQSALVDMTSITPTI
ncbi:tyrosine-type recombinase/integrase [Limosilactobacillus caviae]|jgi:integrase/recombinase XerD|uniref:Recombinase XerD n=1 Tax=Limosilactobacillus caviae TaxID=1769424 RepID=A0ABQ2C8I3_9LACO|nr:tyrosine-type recombinase/integrase [Limosilactobacillus caviae]MRH47329.1 tyrosine-type recombinase/integrase [Limosilactobacillus reuteri]GGI64322.1 recombinase XerD [Limosilactobacillus caviae]